jgi:hypothetical protein
MNHDAQDGVLGMPFGRSDRTQNV